MAQQIEVTGGAEWIVSPDREEHRAFENESLVLIGNTEPIQ